MQVAIRSYLIAGVSAVAVSAIAISPVSPLPDIEIHAPAITLAASPIDAYAAVFQAALANSGDLLTAFLADPAPILTQVADNQLASIGLLAETFGTFASTSVTTLTTVVPALLQVATQQLLAGNVEGAINTLTQAGLAALSPLFALPAPITAVLTQPVQNLVHVLTALTAPATIQNLGIGLLGPVISTIGATGAAIQNVLDAVGTGDPVGVFNAVLTGPATIADGLLNGGYGPNLAPVGAPFQLFAGGILSPGGPVAPTTIIAPGPIATLGNLSNIIAGVLVPVSTPVVQANKSIAPAEENTFVSLSVGATDTDVKAPVKPGPRSGSKTTAKPGAASDPSSAREAKADNAGSQSKDKPKRTSGSAKKVASASSGDSSK